jgi:hypothetical protein
MRKAEVVLLALIAALIVLGLVGFNRPSATINRIHPGMTLAEVEQVMGHPGTEIPESAVETVVDRSVPAGNPRRVRPVISGERYFRWYQGSGQIIVSLRGELVAEKWYYESDL